MNHYKEPCETHLLRLENLIKQGAQICTTDEEKKILMTAEILQQGMTLRKASYFGSKFSGCSKFKEKSHHVIVALLGSEE